MSGSTDLLLKSTLALIIQFSHSLSSRPSLQNADESLSSPLPLLSAAAAALKAQVTKLSLLTITAPYTASAVSKNLLSLNDSILPSITTATLLITPEAFTTSFEAETTHLTRKTLKDLNELIELVQARNGDKKPKVEMAETDKKGITEATGRVWESCDELVKFASGGLGGFAVKKATQWLDLMKDAVKELQDYDPEEDDDDGGLFDDGLDGPSVQQADGEEKDNSSGTIKAGVKTEALKVITRVPQSIHVVIKQRLARLPAPSELSASQRATVDVILSQARSISEIIDECAENMYLGDLEGCLKRAGQARQMTIEVVESVIPPWTQPESTETKEDLYIKRALQWVRQVEPTPAAVKATSSTANGT